jgi:hypothetical protein
LPKSTVGFLLPGPQAIVPSTVPFAQVRRCAPGRRRRENQSRPRSRLFPPCVIPSSSRLFFRVCCNTSHSNILARFGPLADRGRETGALKPQSNRVVNRRSCVASAAYIEASLPLTRTCSNFRPLTSTAVSFSSVSCTSKSLRVMSLISVCPGFGRIVPNDPKRP